MRAVGAELATFYFGYRRGITRLRRVASLEWNWNDVKEVFYDHGVRRSHSFKKKWFTREKR